MVQPIADVSQVTPDWLTHALRQRGRLSRGEVVAVESQTSNIFSSSVAHLTLRYSDDAPQQTPRQLFLKMGGAVPGIMERGKPEIRFYQAVADSGSALPMPYCYDAVYSDDTGRFHLLLEDLSETHVALVNELPPLEPQCDQLMDTLAHLADFGRQFRYS